jgi:hypothetical protein
MELTIEIIHSLPGRARLKFGTAIQDFGRFQKEVMEHEGFESYEYSPVTKTALVKFDKNVVDLQEILIRTAVAYAAENEAGRIRVSQHSKNDFITTRGWISGLTIASAGLLRLIPASNAVIRMFDWIGVATTSSAVLEHAAFDYRKKGSVDPEVLSLLFLANSIVTNNNLLLPSALTWITTFGRHFSAAENEGIMLEINKADGKGKKSVYEVNVSKLNTKNGFMDFLNLFAENFMNSTVGFKNSIFEDSKELTKMHEDNALEGVGEKIKGIVLNFKS